MGVQERYTSPIDGCTVDYSEALALRPDAVTDAVALVAAADVNHSSIESLRILELGCGAAPFLTLVAKRLRRDISIEVVALDLSENALSFARKNLERTLKMRKNPNDSLYLVNKSWTDLELEAENMQLSYFNPPYLPEGEAVREEWKDAPKEAMYVAGSFDGLDHYRWFVPRIDRFMSPEGSTFIRTPRDYASYMTILDLARDHNDESKVRPIFVQSPQDQREGKTIAVSSSLSEEQGPLLVEVLDMGTRIYSSMLQFENKKIA